MSNNDVNAVKRSDAPRLEAMQVDGQFVLVEEDNDWGWISIDNPVTAKQ